jgi:hypothetical protein
MLNNKDGVIHAVHTAVAGRTKILSGADIFYLVLMRNISQEIHKLKPTTFTEWRKAGRSLV